MRTQLDLGGLTPGVGVASVPPLRRTSQAFARFNPEIRTGVAELLEHSVRRPPEGSPGTGFDIRRLFSPGPQAREGREDPRTEPHVPAHAAPENPTPITLEDMSDQGGVGSVSKAEATLTHPSARDTHAGAFYE